MMLTIPRIDGTSKYSLKWAMSVLNLHGSGDHNFNMGILLTIIFLEFSYKINFSRKH